MLDNCQIHIYSYGIGINGNLPLNSKNIRATLHAQLYCNDLCTN